jgi:hypothetical protein
LEILSRGIKRKPIEMKIKYPPPGWGRARVGVILGIFSQLREEKGGMRKGRGVVSKPVDGARGFGLKSVYRRLFFALRSLRSPR